MRFHSRTDLIRRARSYSSPGRDVLRGAARGGVAGVLVAGCALVVGAVRLGIRMAAGARVSDVGLRDLQLMVAYVAAFAVGGAVVGIVTTRWDGRFAVSAACMTAGAIVMNTIGLVDRGERGYDLPTAMILTALGATLGLAFAYGMLRKS